MTSSEKLAAHRKKLAAKRKRVGTVREMPLAPGPDIPKPIANSAASFFQNFLQENIGGSHGLKDSASIAKAINQVRISSRKAHIEGLTMAYALFAAQTDSDAAILTHEIVEKSDLTSTNGRPRTKLRVILESILSYGDNRDPDSTRRARNLYSRDEAAIIHLVSRGIFPDEVVQLSKKKGEGVDAWSRKAPARYRKKAEPKQASIEAAANEKLSKGSKVLVADDEFEGCWWEAKVIRVKTNTATVQFWYQHEPSDKKKFEVEVSSLFTLQRV